MVPVGVGMFASVIIAMNFDLHCLSFVVMAIKYPKS